MSEPARAEGFGRGARIVTAANAAVLIGLAFTVLLVVTLIVAQA